MGDHDNQIIYNYFYEDQSLLKLLYFPKVDKILNEVLDKNYILQSSNAQNRIIDKYKIKKIKKITKLDLHGILTAGISVEKKFLRDFRIL